MRGDVCVRHENQKLVGSGCAKGREGPPPKKNIIINRNIKDQDGKKNGSEGERAPPPQLFVGAGAGHALRCPRLHSPGQVRQRQQYEHDVEAYHKTQPKTNAPLRGREDTCHM